MPRITASVVIPVKNPGPIFREVVAAACGQYFPDGHEVIIIDSGSTDGTADWLRGQRGIKLIEIPSRQFGHGRTRNLGVEEAEGDYVAFLTHDALPADRYWLTNLVAPFKGRPDVAAVFGRHLPYSSASPPTKHNLLTGFEAFKQKPFQFIESEADYEGNTQLRQFLHFYSDNNSCLRKSVWNIIPYPDVEFAEDQLWAKAIIEAGYTKAYAHNAAVYHSHDWGPVTTGRRSFDEAMFFRLYFGYKMCPSIIHGISNIIRLTRRDFSLYRAAFPKGSVLECFIRAFSVNFFMQVGYYFGQRHKVLPRSAIARISLDHSLKAGASRHVQA